MLERPIDKQEVYRAKINLFQTTKQNPRKIVLNKKEGSVERVGITLAKKVKAPFTQEGGRYTPLTSRPAVNSSVKNANSSKHSDLSNQYVFSTQCSTNRKKSAGRSICASEASTGKRGDGSVSREAIDRIKGFYQPASSKSRSKSPFANNTNNVNNTGSLLSFYSGKGSSGIMTKSSSSFIQTQTDLSTRSSCLIG